MSGLGAETFSFQSILLEHAGPALNGVGVQCQVSVVNGVGQETEQDMGSETITASFDPYIRLDLSR